MAPPARTIFLPLREVFTLATGSRPAYSAGAGRDLVFTEPHKVRTGQIGWITSLIGGSAVGQAVVNIAPPGSRVVTGGWLVRWVPMVALAAREVHRVTRRDSLVRGCAEPGTTRACSAAEAAVTPARCGRHRRCGGVSGEAWAERAAASSRLAVWPLAAGLAGGQFG